MTALGNQSVHLQKSAHLFRNSQWRMPSLGPPWLCSGKRLYRLGLRHAEAGCKKRARFKGSCLKALRMSLFDLRIALARRMELTGRGWERVNLMTLCFFFFIRYGIFSRLGSVVMHCFTSCGTKRAEPLVRLLVLGWAKDVVSAAVGRDCQRRTHRNWSVGFIAVTGHHSLFEPALLS